ncbi:carbohydrate kinase, YjeF-like protein [Candidatus Omnitrophus magneticus]|uniref:NAD(P)H-hydrate epimerase n=1 Tax=Candidatus Omnitrophus magneticus TaxID=1609969 RepID=A0A0F0CV10_9BACT|nr:carbohydrate kinase, YjeF-like protein [Candidatus Omnitrophus magneticus]
MKTVTSREMFEIERQAIDIYGIPTSVLMENAARCVAETILKDFRFMKNERIAVLAGKGNNGGDGFAAARYLFNASPKSLTVFCPEASSIKSGTAKTNHDIIRKMGIEIKLLNEFLNEDIKNFTICVDALFGIGFSGELLGDYALIGEKVNRSFLKCYAVDVPSGLDASTGIASKNCLKSCKTITFGLAKTGFYSNDGPKVCGEILIKDIGFPKILLQ